MKKNYQFVDFDIDEDVQVGDIFIDENGDEVICVRPMDGDGDYTFIETGDLLGDLPAEYTKDDLLNVDIDEYEYYYDNNEDMSEDGWQRVVLIQKTADDNFIDGLFK